MSKLWLWERADGRPARVVGEKTRPPGPGRVFEVEADSADEARTVLTDAKRELPDLSEKSLELLSPAERGDRRKRQVEILTQRERVRVVDLDVEAPPPKPKTDDTPITLQAPTEPTKGGKK